MDVGNPSNFSRIISLFTPEWIKSVLKFKVVTDFETEKEKFTSDLRNLLNPNPEICLQFCKFVLPIF